MKNFLLKLLLGKNYKTLEKIGEQLYEDIWPKHHMYEKENKILIRTAILKAYDFGKNERWK